MPVTPDALVSAATVGAVLASRRPRHPVGWLLLAQVASNLATGAAAQYLAWGLLAVGPLPVDYSPNNLQVNSSGFILTGPSGGESERIPAV